MSGTSMDGLDCCLSKIYLDKTYKFKYDIIDHPDSYPSDEPQRRCPDISKAQLQLNFQPKVSLDEGLVKFFDWALKTY